MADLPQTRYFRASNSVLDDQHATNAIDFNTGNICIHYGIKLGIFLAAFYVPWDPDYPAIRAGSPHDAAGSLPNMLVIGSVMGVKKTATFCGIIVVMSTVAGMLYGFIAA